jgi:hypothetical protein
MLNSQGVAPAQTAASAEHLTLAWFAKRSVLWVLIVAMGIGAACGLYAAAGESTDAKANASVDAKANASVKVRALPNI